MADGDVLYDPQSDDQVTDHSDIQQSSALRRDKVVARQASVAQRAGSATKAAGRTTQAAGVSTQAVGKTVKYSGKAVKAAGRGASKGGQAMTEAGVALSGTGLGAIVGVPLAAVGVATTALGAGAQATGSVMDKGGDIVDRSGRTMRQTGSKMVKTGDRMAQSGAKGASLRSDKHQSRFLSRLKSRLKNRSDDSESLTVDLMVDGFRMGTDNLLRIAWLYLLPSLGLTLLYIHAHVILRFAIGEDYFCKLGDEWTGFLTQGAAGASHLPGSSLVTKTVDKLSDKLGWLEVALLVCLDFLIIGLIIFVGSFMSIIGYIVANPVEATIKLFGEMAKIIIEMTKGQ